MLGVELCREPGEHVGCRGVQGAGTGKVGKGPGRNNVALRIVALNEALLQCWGQINEGFAEVEWPGHLVGEQTRVWFSGAHGERLPEQLYAGVAVGVRRCGIPGDAMMAQEAVELGNVVVGMGVRGVADDEVVGGER